MRRLSADRSPLTLRLRRRREGCRWRLMAGRAAGQMPSDPMAVTERWPTRQWDVC